MITNPVINSTIGTGGNAASLGIFQRFLSNFITIAFGLGVIILFFMLIWGGITYISARGDKEAVQRGSKTIFNALIGIVILFSTYAILRLIAMLFGIDILHLAIPAY
jgi:hypothetical protein